MDDEGESEGAPRSTDCHHESGIAKENIRYIFGGDLLGQLIGSTFGLKDFQIPIFGLYGACSTCGEALSLAAMTVNAGYASHVIAVTSSHFGGAENSSGFHWNTETSAHSLLPGQSLEAAHSSYLQPVQISR